MKSIENRNEGIISKLNKTKKINKTFLPKGLNLNILLVNTLTTIAASGLSIAAGWNNEITFKIAIFSFLTSQIIMWITLNYLHIKTSLSVFSYLLVFSLPALLFFYAKTNYNADYEIINNNVKIIELNEQIKQLESLKLHKVRLEKQLATYRELNNQKQVFQNLTCSEAVNAVENVINQNLGSEK